MPGITLNLSKRGISTTVGIPGASVNFNRQGTFLNTGIPGTGLYDRKRLDGKKRINHSELHDAEHKTFQQKKSTETVKSNVNVEETTTEGLQDLRTALVSCFQLLQDLKKAIIKAKTALQLSQILLYTSNFLLVGLIFKWFKEKRDQKLEFLTDHEKCLAACFLYIDINTDDQIESSYFALLESYRTLLSSQKIWDITSTQKIDQIGLKSTASESILRKEVKFGYGNLETIKSKYDALHFENANGGDLYIYPGFVAMVDDNQNFGLIDIREMEFGFKTQKFIEEEGVPSDVQIFGTTWAKVNKNGTPDKRFRDNYEIPICLYGRLELKSNTGLNEVYLISNHEKAKHFSMMFERYQEMMKS
ncbi:DUF4236 domain-containing protein [Anditalea andensis]|uniref:DUF4236 domain-containing protein n=1 Tax=Anditalea andensis TaxID=1048983 RepID=A0A074L6H3_9BACT|nr:DUF4236 domain-containing protein [Anditalea andensis]KEO75433.1 hypothetical protein EL17_00810 [Anditalea andensis]